MDQVVHTREWSKPHLQRPDQRKHHSNSVERTFYGPPPHQHKHTWSTTPKPTNCSNTSPSPAVVRWSTPTPYGGVAARTTAAHHHPTKGAPERERSWRGLARERSYSMTEEKPPRERLEVLLPHYEHGEHLVPLAILAAAEVVADAIRDVKGGDA